MSRNLRLVEHKFARLDNWERDLEKRYQRPMGRFPRQNADPTLEKYGNQLELLEDLMLPTKSQRAVESVSAAESSVKHDLTQGFVSQAARLKNQVAQFLTQQNAFAQVPQSQHRSDDTQFEEQHQEENISKLVSSRSVAAPSGHESVARPLSTNGVRKLSLFRGSPQQVSPFANQKPLKLRPGTAEKSPLKSNAPLNARYAFSASGAHQRVPRDPPKIAQNENLASSAAHQLELSRIPRVAQSKEFYFLVVRILHETSSLKNWEFLLRVCDITDADHLRFHTFNNLRVNDHKALIIHPPSNIILSPLDDIPWVAGPDSLYSHTLRLEVFAVYPVKTKVVDNIVFFGIKE